MCKNMNKIWEEKKTFIPESAKKKKKVDVARLLIALKNLRWSFHINCFHPDAGLGSVPLRTATQRRR